jgi:hypothetical protein
MRDDDDKLIARDELPTVIREATGLKLTPGTLNKLCSPSRGEGPPVEGYVGRRPFYSTKKTIEWAMNRLRPERHILHPEK